MWVLVGLCAMGWVRTAVGQEAVNIEAIRKTDLNGVLDKQQVEQWVTRQLDSLFSAAEPLPAASSFHRQMLEHFKATDATAGFKDGLAQVLAKAFTDLYKPSASEARSIPTVMALVVLKACGHPSALPCFRAALKDAAASVRLAATDGLLAGKTPPADWASLLGDLQQAAVTEPDPVTLGRLVRLITKEAGPPADQATAALLKILDARLARFETRGEFPTLADAAMATWLGERCAAVTEARIRGDIVRRLARLLADAVHTYIQEDTREPPEDEFQREASEVRRDELAQIVAAVELQLRAVVKPAEPQPNVTAALFEASPQDRRDKMAQQLGLWIGSEQDAGVLNGAPFNFERGLNIQRTPPASQPGSGAAAG